MPSSQAAPGHGVLPVNAYVIGDRAPVLVDTGLPTEADDFLARLWSVVEPQDLACVFLTHEDHDHAGNLLAVLDAAPQARLVTNYVTVGKLLEATTLPLDRVVVVNPGERVPGIERELWVLRPPAYDSPGTVGLHDERTGAVFTVDAFGTYLPEVADRLEDVPEDDAVAGLVDFNRANHPWTTLAAADRFAAAVASVGRLEPRVLLSSHGLPAAGRIPALLAAMARRPTLEPYVPPDQGRFEELRPEMGG
ncbi:MAG TPA: MBL fold metallo-hydrolase [Acidimicrobiales bacterium]|nr:MBL fold metallo-hydrolase [Acidimicrobiales bacterium]